MIRPRNIRTALVVFACVLGGTFRTDAQSTLSGRVLDQSDSGVAGAQLSFFDDGDRFAQSTTDDGGVYSVDLRASSVPSAVLPIPWAVLKAGGAGKRLQPTADSVFPSSFSVTIIHPEVDTLTLEGLSVPESGVLDFQVLRVDSGELTDPGTGPGDISDPDPPEPVDETPSLNLVLDEAGRVSLEGVYIRGLAVAVLDSSLAVGDTVIIHFIGIGVSGVRQVEFLLDVPDGAVNVAGASFLPASPYINPGNSVTQASDTRLHFGAASLSSETTADLFDFGELRLPTVGTIPAGTVVLQILSVGPRSSVRDDFEHMDLTLPVRVD